MPIEAEALSLDHWTTREAPHFAVSQLQNALSLCDSFLAKCSVCVRGKLLCSDNDQN